MWRESTLTAAERCHNNCFAAQPFTVERISLLAPSGKNGKPNSIIEARRTTTAGVKRRIGSDERSDERRTSTALWRLAVRSTIDATLATHRVTIHRATTHPARCTDRLLKQTRNDADLTPFRLHCRLFNTLANRLQGITGLACFTACTVAVWCSGNALVNEVNLRWARLVLGWVTVSGVDSRRRHFISACNQPPRLTQPSSVRLTVKWVPAKGR